MKRQYHTPQGSIIREPTPEELAMEWEMRKEETGLQIIRDTLAELMNKTPKEVEDIMKKHYKG